MRQAVFFQGVGDLKVEHVSCTLPEPAGPITRTPNLLILALLGTEDGRGLGR